MIREQQQQEKTHNYWIPIDSFEEKKKLIIIEWIESMIECFRMKMETLSLFIINYTEKSKFDSKNSVKMSIQISISQFENSQNHKKPD